MRYKPQSARLCGNSGGTAEFYLRPFIRGGDFYFSVLFSRISGIKKNKLSESEEHNMKKLLEEIRKRAKSEFDSGADAETFRIKYLG